MDRTWQPDHPDKVRLYNALLAAFHDHASLKSMVWLGLGVRLDHIPGHGDVPTRVQALIDWAISKGRFIDLLAAARHANPGNPELAAYIESLPTEIVEQVSTAIAALDARGASSSEVRRKLIPVVWLTVVPSAFAIALYVGWAMLVGPDAPPPTRTQISTQAHTLSGMVTEVDGATIPDALVSIDERNERDVTTTSGSFHLTLPADVKEPVRLRVKKRGYDEWVERISVPNNQIRVQLIRNQ